MRLSFLPILMLVLSFAWDSHAESPPDFPKFTTKRVKPPAPGTKKRINIQIKGQNLLPPPPKTEEKSDPTPKKPIEKGTYAWFWDVVSPDLSQSGPGRLQQAINALNNPPAGQYANAPRLEDLHRIAKAYGTEVLRATVGTNISPALVLAVIHVESSGNPAAVSKSGAQGLMQLIPATAARFNVADAMNPEMNIKGGTEYLGWLMERFNNDPILAIAGYNAGENSIPANNGVPPYTETRDYVPKVLAAFNVAKGLCKVPPELVSDGCIFINR